MSSPRRRQRRCVICHRGFLAHPRVGDRQRACEREECQQELRRRNQAAWRKANPGYFIAWRAKQRMARNAKEPVDPPRVPAPLNRLPWGLAQEEFGVGGADFLGSMGRALLAGSSHRVPVKATDTSGRFPATDAKSSIPSQALDPTGESGQEGATDAKSSILSQPLDPTGKFGQEGAG